MTRAQLLACPSCARHVRADEATCPFCRATVPAAFADAPRPRRPVGRLNRAALYALGASSLGLVAACSGKIAGGPDASDDGGDAAADDGSTFDAIGVAAYGGACVEDSGCTIMVLDGGPSEEDAAPDTGFAPPYGIAPNPDE